MQFASLNSPCTEVLGGCLGAGGTLAASFTGLGNAEMNPGDAAETRSKQKEL